MAWAQDHLRVLKKNRLHMVKNIDLANTELWDALVTREVVSSTQRDNIEGRNKANNKQVSALLTHLEKRPTNDFKEFLQALHETDQQDIAEFLAGQIGYVIPSEDPDKSKYPQTAGIVSQPSKQATGTAVQPQDIAEGVRDINMRNMKASTWEFYQSVKHRSYDLTGPEKGRVLMVNVTKHREGCEVDEKTMTDLFTDLGFSVVPLKDPDYLELDDALRNFVTDPANKKAKCVFVIMMAHGGMNRGRLFINLRNGAECFFREKLDDFFSSTNCPDLIGKPKVYIIQACMGTKLDTGTLVTALGNPVKQTEETDDATRQVSGENTIIPTLFDCLYAFATVPAFKAVRNTIDGSLFLREISEIFRADAHNTHVSDMLTTVRSNVAEKTGRSSAEKIAQAQLKAKLEGAEEENPGEVFVQTTHNVDMLAKRLFLFPGI